MARIPVDEIDFDTFPLERSRIWLFNLLLTPLAGVVLYYAWRDRFPTAARYANRTSLFTAAVWVALVAGGGALLGRLAGSGNDPLADMLASVGTYDPGDGGPDPCTLIPEVELEQLAGGDLVVEERLSFGGMRVCGFRGIASDESRPLVVRLTIDRTGEEEFQSDFELASIGEETRWIEGLGEGAYAAGATVRVRRGSELLVVSVSRPIDDLEREPFPDVAERIARRIVG